MPASLQIARREARTPSAPIDRFPADAVGESREIDVATPRQAPHELAGLLRIVRRRDRARHIEPQSREILHVLGDEKASCVEEQHTFVCRAPKDLRRTVRAIHAGADDDRREGCTAVARRLFPRAACEAAQHVHGERRVLDIDLVKPGKSCGSGISHPPAFQKATAPA